MWFECMFSVRCWLTNTPETPRESDVFKSSSLLPFWQRQFSHMFIECFNACASDRNSVLHTLKQWHIIQRWGNRLRKWFADDTCIRYFSLLRLRYKFLSEQKIYCIWSMIRLFDFNLRKQMNKNESGCLIIRVETKWVVIELAFYFGKSVVTVALLLLQKTFI